MLEQGLHCLECGVGQASFITLSGPPANNMEREVLVGLVIE